MNVTTKTLAIKAVVACTSMKSVSTFRGRVDRFELPLADVVTTAAGFD
jgi:hypothetical protein